VNFIALGCYTLQQWTSVTSFQHFVHFVVGQLALFIFLDCEQKPLEILSSVTGRLSGLLALQMQPAPSSNLHYL
jgi:hypothetical protein